MQGIEILNKEPIMEFTDAGKTIGIIFTILLIISFLCLWIFDKASGVIGVTGMTISAIICVVSILVTIINIKFNEKPSGRYTYEATIDDDVSINEVYKHYDVIEQDGKKWILEDKEGAE